MLNVELFIQDNYPGFYRDYPLVARPITKFLRALFKESVFQDFENNYPYLQGFDFVEQVLDYFDFHYKVRDDERRHIPEEGRLIIVANHPIGSLDGLALLKLIGETRQDVKVVANDLLCNLHPLRKLLLPVDNMNGSTPLQNLKAIHRHLNNEGAIIMFPAGEVSRLQPLGIRDGAWQKGFINMAFRTEAPILPVYVKARNSTLFYSVSLLAKRLSTLLLIREMCKQTSHCIDIKIGKAIQHQHYQFLKNLPPKKRTRFFKKHVYRIGRSKNGLFETTNTIAHQEDRLLLREEITQCENLGNTADGMKICLFRYKSDSHIMREVGRLREIAFRAVGEGTGNRRDIDNYDPHYLHLILWNENALEIVGAYRFCDARNYRKNLGSGHLYSAELFEYTNAMEPYFKRGLELGRSFVQPKYWGRHSLDYLWQGIGAFLRKNPRYRYLFGPVTLSNDYPLWAREKLVYFYGRHYASKEVLATPTNPFVIGEHKQQMLTEEFPGEDTVGEFKHLKRDLENSDLRIPTLYKQYTEICEPGGVQFSGFNVDPDFADCIDGLIIVDLERIKPCKRKRYLSSKLTN
jgi:putative hemolysin